MALDLATPTVALDSPLPPVPAPKEPLQLQLAVTPEAALPGQEVAYTLTLTNTGATRLRNVAVNAVFAPALVYLPGDQGEYDPDSFTLAHLWLGKRPR